MIPILRASDAGELKRRVMNRSQLQNEEVSRIVKEIVARVRQEGDAALFDYTAKFDHVTMTAGLGPITAITPKAAPMASVRRRPKIVRTCSGKAFVATS